MNLTSDQQIFWQHGFIKLNGTIVTTWVMMLLMALVAKLITRKLAAEGPISRWQGRARNHHYRYRKTNCRCRIKPTKEVSFVFGNTLLVCSHL